LIFDVAGARAGAWTTGSLLPSTSRPSEPRWTANWTRTSTEVGLSLTILVSVSCGTFIALVGHDNFTLVKTTQVLRDLLRLIRCSLLFHSFSPFLRSPLTLLKAYMTQQIDAVALFSEM
jgi:hypothetical protein